MSAVRETREMASLLQSDLFKETEPLDPEVWARAWLSPLKWRVEYVITRRDPDKHPGSGARIRCRIVDPKGKQYASSEDATLDWLDGALP